MVKNTELPAFRELTADAEMYLESLGWTDYSLPSLNFTEPENAGWLLLADFDTGKVPDVATLPVLVRVPGPEQLMYVSVIVRLDDPKHLEFRLPKFEITTP